MQDSVRLDKPTAQSTIEELIEKDALEKKVEVYLENESLFKNEIFLLEEKVETYQAESEVNFSLYQVAKKNIAKIEGLLKISEKELSGSKSTNWILKYIVIPASVIVGFLIGNNL